MQTARRFEDLIAWQLSNELCELIFRLTEAQEVLKDPEFRDQIRRAAQNAPALIAEGFLRYTPDEFVRYLRMARGELGELQSRLAHARSEKYFTEEECESAATLARRAMAVTTGLLKSKLPEARKRAQQLRDDPTVSTATLSTSTWQHPARRTWHPARHLAPSTQHSPVARGTKHPPLAPGTCPFSPLDVPPAALL